MTRHIDLSYDVFMAMPRQQGTTMETLSLYPAKYDALSRDGSLLAYVGVPENFPVGRNVLVARVSVTTERDTGAYLMAKVEGVSMRGTATFVTLVVQPSATCAEGVQVAP